ncbi:RagB/SusD family nutrient uptake outer membrane protein [Bacteroides sp. HF-5092]|uniref:RagB/SusD family nutrient uptake outer membrane protein n=1 Tax=Bacteroides TaxID=816 RepID=UPI0011774D09|nr:MULTISPECIES: RagB/SusD family nutrient uptake outer membrane protein [Bacteroides]TRX43874.1 RagB/SusD family nutrient uptake outer membrane protein [Bacteroides sp. HF-5092]
MKKFTLYSFAALALMLGTASCGDDFLSVEPSSSLPIDGYYTTESRMMESAVAAYDPMQWYDYFGGWAPLSLVWDSMADDMYVGGGNTSDQSQIHLISQYKSDPRNNIDGAWTTSYSGINRSIRLIDNAKDSDLSDDKKALFIAEGRAMRAWYYLVLWKTWGNIPFYEENLTSLPYLADQLTAEQVYEKVVVDLESVLDSEVLPMKQPDEWAGRMTQAAASMIYADYVMYQKDQSRYGKALGYMKAIINSHKYDLVKNYNDLYALDKEWNEEIIFDVNYIAKGGKRTWGNANFTGGTVYPEMIGIDGLTIKCAEGHTPEFTSGWGFGSVSKEVYDAFEDNDRRRDVAILNLDKYARAKFAEGDTVTYGGRYQNTGYFLRKYLPRPGDTEGSVGDAGLNHDENLHLYRYAETLLNAAELALATGDGLAQDYFDLVRERAGVASIPVTVDNIINERRLEFVGEGKRYFDLVRSGKAATVLKAGAGVVLRTKRTYNFDKNQWEGENTWGGQAIPERVDWTENKKYIPIPQSEIEAAQGSITQNPY